MCDNAPITFMRPPILKAEIGFRHWLFFRGFDCKASELPANHVTELQPMKSATEKTTTNALLPEGGKSRLQPERAARSPRDNLLLVSGTRPEIIKLAPVYRALRELAWAHVQWLHTGQHDEMARQIFESFAVTPDIALQRPGGSLLDFSVACRAQLEQVMARQQWSLVIVQGDTESAFQGALAAFYNRVPLAHVEAGLRTYNLQRPFPEEGLRQMISRLAGFNFAPTARARAALIAEGITGELIHVTGNTVIDAQQWACARHGIKRKVTGRGHLLVTVHRRENWGDELAQVCLAVAELAAGDPSLDVLFPVHLNPAVRGPVHAILGNCANVRLLPPLDYLEMQQALADAWIVLSDSGGLQEEAPTFGVPVLVLREETERPEAIEAGCARIVGTRQDAIVSEVLRLRDDAGAMQRMQRAGNPFGDGHAASRIAAVLTGYFVPLQSAASASR
jgi:UDP-N-acetylglucosamine 2-epimerase (non-hydrolysing)